MKRQRLLVALAALALLGLLSLQVLWITRSAGIKEEQFSQRVTMALSRTAEEFCAARTNCSSLDNCCMSSDAGCSIVLEADQRALVDSLLQKSLRFYHVNLEYEFEILRINSLPMLQANLSKGTFCQDISDKDLQGDYQLKLHLPDTAAFIRAEMGPAFGLSLALIALLIGIFVITLRSLFKARTVLQRTTDFVNNMTHELKTPLANISLATNMLGNEKLPQEKRDIYANIIRAENEKLKLQVERLLSLSALEDGEVGLHPETLDAHQLLSELADCMRVQAQERGGKLTLELQAERAQLSADRLLLSNALCNLLDNALKYSKEAPEVFIRTRNENNFLLIEISDNGVGIPEKEQALVFERFYRVSQGDVHDAKGFGLGLPYVKKIAELHGGKIELSSETGKGSVFTLHLPLIA